MGCDSIWHCYIFTLTAGIWDVFLFFFLSHWKKKYHTKHSCVLVTDSEWKRQTADYSISLPPFRNGHQCLSSFTPHSPAAAPNLWALSSRLLSVLKEEISREDGNLSPHSDSLARRLSLGLLRRHAPLQLLLLSSPLLSSLLLLFSSLFCPIMFSRSSHLLTSTLHVSSSTLAVLASSSYLVCQRHWWLSAASHPPCNAVSLH